MASIHTLARWASAVTLCAVLHAQSQNIVHIRILDGKTGLSVDASNFLVRVDHHQTIHNEWVRIDDDGTVTVTLPANVKEIAVKATYDLSLQTYIDCDIAKENDNERDVWYPVSAILQTGVVARNECGKTNYTAKPGEFIFFVRKRNWREQEH